MVMSKTNVYQVFNDTPDRCGSYIYNTTETDETDKSVFDCFCHRQIHKMLFELKACSDCPAQLQGFMRTLIGKILQKQVGQ